MRKDRAILENDARWIYNDLQRGFAEARLTGKPLLVVLRCVPCTACAGIDAAVLLQESELGPLLDHFICVRVIDANALDLVRRRRIRVVTTRIPPRRNRPTITRPILPRPAVRTIAMRTAVRSRTTRCRRPGR